MPTSLPNGLSATGTVVEVRQYHQYVIRMDGTGRVTIRNRQHLRKFTPFHTPSTQGLLGTPTVERSEEVVHNYSAKGAYAYYSTK